MNDWSERKPCGRRRLGDMFVEGQRVGRNLVIKVFDWSGGRIAGQRYLARCLGTDQRTGEPCNHERVLLHRNIKKQQEKNSLGCKKCAPRHRGGRPRKMDDTWIAQCWPKVPSDPGGYKLWGQR